LSACFNLGYWSMCKTFCHSLFSVVTRSCCYTTFAYFTAATFVQRADDFWCRKDIKPFEKNLFVSTFVSIYQFPHSTVVNWSSPVQVHVVQVYLISSCSSQQPLVSDLHMHKTLQNHVITKQLEYTSMLSCEYKAKKHNVTLLY